MNMYMRRHDETYMYIYRVTISSSVIFKQNVISNESMTEIFYKSNI